MTRRISALFALCFMAHAPAMLADNAGGDAFAPPTYDIQRYEHIWKRSPFIVESVAVADSPGLASKYSLMGAAIVGDKAVAFLLDKNSADPNQSRITLSQVHPSQEQLNKSLQLVSVNLSDNPSVTSAVIRQGSDQATLTIDASVLNTLTGGGSAVGTEAPRPGGLPIPGLPGRPFIPPPPQPSAAAVPAPAPSNASPNPPQPTRRIIRPAPVQVN
jgi:hypothetical protein